MDKHLQDLADIFREYLTFLKSTPETLKVGAALSAPGLQLLGATVEEWAFILSGIVSLLVILEKFPVVTKRAKNIGNWMRNKYAVWKRKVKRS